MTTIVDIANKLGLSKSTVSRALSNNSEVSEKTRVLVKKTAKEMNYVGNQIARNLVKRQTNMVGFMIPDISDGFFPKMAIAVENTLSLAGYAVSYSNVSRDPSKVMNFLDSAIEQMMNGVFITLDDWSEEVCAKIASLRIPVISLRRKTIATLTDIVPYVDSDHYEGVDRGVRYLLSLNHNNIGYIGYDTLVGRERTEAYKRSIRELGIDEHIVYNPCYQNPQIRIQIGYQSTKKLFQDAPQITAIFAGDDQLALGVLQFAEENRIRVPEDLSVLGYDNRDIAQLYCIQLSSIHQQIEDIGNRAAALMIEMITNKEADKVFDSILVSPTLVTRRTTGKRRG